MLRDIEVRLPWGEMKRFGDLATGAALVVNVASKCGFKPHYAGLEELYQEFGPQGLSAIGMPCNQFLFQEPGTEAEIAEFYSLTCSVDCQLLARGKVNGKGVAPLFLELRHAKAPAGEAATVRWNFEKFCRQPRPRRRWRAMGQAISVEDGAP